MPINAPGGQRFITSAKANEKRETGNGKRFGAEISPVKERGAETVPRSPDEFFMYNNIYIRFVNKMF